MEFPDTTLNSALTNHLSTAFVSLMIKPDLDTDIRSRNLSSNHLPRELAQGLKSVMKSNENTGEFVVHNASHTPDLLSMPPDSTADLDMATTRINSCFEIAQILKEALRCGLGDKVHPSCDIDASKDQLDLDIGLEPSPSTIQYYLRAAIWQRLVDETSRQSSSSRKWIRIPSGFTNRHLTVILNAGKWIVLPRDATLMIKDIAWGVFLIHLYADIDLDHAHLRGIITFIHQWSFKRMRLYGDEAYNLIKMLEPVCVARLIQMSESHLDPNIQLELMIQKYRDAEIEILNNSSILLAGKELMADSLNSFLQSLNDPEAIAEVFSCLKMSGHPYVDPIAGSQAIEKLAKAPTSASYSGIKAVGWSFCHMFTKGYIDKMKKWPPLVFNLPEGKQSILKQLHDQNHSPLPLGISIYDPSDWDYVTFLPVDEFDYGVDILSLITDKSLSYKRSEVDNSWAGRLNYKPKKATSSTRVLEQLLRGDLNLKDICDMVSSGEIPFDWKIVTVHPKEREMKALIARMFAIMVLEMRTFFCLLEHNLAEKLFKFIPEQTMTMSQSEEEEVFISITNQTLERISLSIGLDLSKWCSHFREHTVSPISDRVNQLLGVFGLYGYVHRFFRDSLIVLRHPSFIPIQDPKGKVGNLSEEPGIYTGAEAGLEGIQQKLWTLVTLCMLHWAVWRFGFSYNITCQADNLVLHIFLHKTLSESPDQFSQRVRTINKNVTLSVSKAAEMIGHDINPDECFSSTNFTTYGKNMWFKGRKLETILKVVTRMFPKTTCDTPSTESIIANIAATGTSLVERTNNPSTAFLFTKIVEYLVIGRELTMSLVHGNRISLIKESRLWGLKESGFPLLVVLIPSNLGGLPVSCFAEFLYRGHSDPLSSSLGSLDVLRSIPIVDKFLYCLQSTNFVGIEDHQSALGNRQSRARFRLVRDPYSIPLKASKGAVERTSEHVLETLHQITRNKLLRPIVKLATDSSGEDELIQNLLEIRPVSPKILYEIHKASVYGVGKAISKRFTDTRTLRRITGEDIDLVRSHINNDLTHIRDTLRFLSQVLSQSGIRDKTFLPTYQLLIDLRLRWGLGILEGVTNYHPLVAGKWLISNQLDISSMVKIVDNPSNPLLIVSSLTDSSEQCGRSRGGEAPFLGNLTSEKAISKWTRPIDASPPLKDALRLLQISKLCTTPLSHLRSLIEALAVSRTSLPLDILYEMAKEQVGGTTAHRLNLSVALQGSRISTLPNWSTHLTVSSNLSREVGANDYPISFNEYYLTLICMSRLFFKKARVEAPFSLVFLIDTSLLTPVQDMILILDQPYTPRPVRTPRESYYLYATSVTLSARSRIGEGMPFLGFPPRQATCVQALSQLFLSTLTSSHKLVRQQGYTRTQTSHRLTVDLPEATLLSLDEYLDGAAMTILLYSSSTIVRRLYKHTPPTTTCLQTFLEVSLLLAPLIYKTVSMSSDNSDPLLRESAGSRTSERSIIHLSCLITRRALLIILSSPSLPIPPVFEHTVGQMSQSLASRAYLLVLIQALHFNETIPACKFITRILNKVCNRLTEELRVSGLTNVIKSLHWNLRITVDESAAESRIRSLRERVGRLNKLWETTSFVLPPKGPRSCTATDMELSYSTNRVQMTQELLIESWSLRPFPGRSDSFLKWGPVSSFLPSGSTVYIIGIGAGGLLRCIPSTCKVWGLDLPSTLQPLGQSFVTYKSSEGHPDYTTSSISWMKDLSEEISSANPSVVLDDIKSKRVTHVLIDVDRVSLSNRLKLRYILAKGLGVPVWARVFGSPEEISEVIKSTDSIGMDQDDWWSPGISCSCEVILGSSSRPLGLYKAFGDPDPRVVMFGKSAPTWDELVEFVLRYGGSLSDVDRLEDFIYEGRSKAGEGGLSPFLVYSMCRTDAAGAIAKCGRLLCRVTVYIVQNYI